MIVSHKYKFIHIKNGKVAGTSLEIALSKFLGENDIITPLGTSDEVDRYTRGFMTAQNFEKPLIGMKSKKLPRAIRSRTMSKMTTGQRRVLERKKHPNYYKEHMSAADIKEKVGDHVWNEYFKFAVERNPWDKVVSMYYWDRKNKHKDLTFRDFVLFGKGCKSDFRNYTLNGVFSIDSLLSYENLAKELKDVSCRVGLPTNIYSEMNEIQAKTEYRKLHTYRDFYNKELYDIINLFFAREIKLLNYKF